MNVIDLEQCCKTDYHLKFLGSIDMSQKTDKPIFSCMEHPKKQDMLLFVNDCKTRYFTRDGKTIETKDGDVVYVPKGSRYRVECIKDSEKSSTLQINFLLFDEQYQPFVLSKDILVFTSQSHVLRSLFEKSVIMGKNAAVFPSMQKAVLFEILGTIAEKQGLSSNSIVDNGINYLLAHYSENPSVPYLASICHVSNEYFRKLFKIQTGQTPSQFKNALRIKKAEQYLLYSDLPVAEISELLSFVTVSHFIKCFKDARGCSPLSFRNEFTKSN